jgi:cyclopropane fatty-acyl-phospholipid synthase-like methyltransferase
MKQFSEACERNKEVILKVLKQYIDEFNYSLLEIGSGTGQHAAFFTRELPNVDWYTSDLENRHASILSYKEESQQNNFHGPLLLDLNSPTSLEKSFNCIFSANVLHIVPPLLVENFFKLAGECLENKGYLFLYGPFKVGGIFTSDSNKNFDLHLKQNVSTQSGIRDLEWVQELAKKESLKLLNRHEMPANNFSLVFQKNA